jgi:hypothetical protein
MFYKIIEGLQKEKLLSVYVYLVEKDLLITATLSMDFCFFQFNC